MGADMASDSSLHTAPLPWLKDAAPIPASFAEAALEHLAVVSSLYLTSKVLAASYQSSPVLKPRHRRSASSAFLLLI